MRAELGRLKDAAGGLGGSSGGGLFGDAARGMADVEQGARDLSATLGDDNTDGTTRRANLFFRAIGGLGDGLTRLGSIIDGGGVRGPLTFLRNILAAPLGLVGGLLSGSAALASTGSAAAPLLAVAGAAGAAAAAVGALAIAFFAIPAAAALVTFVISAITVELTTLAAAVVAAAGPLGVLVAVLGGLGFAAMEAFNRLRSSSGPWAVSFRAEISKLSDGFSFLTKQLAVDFLPWFDKVGKIALNVLGYFNHLAVVAGKGGLGAVFKSLVDGGFARLNNDFLSFISPIGDVIAKVIAFAFGRGGAEGEAILKADFSRFGEWFSKAFAPVEAWLARQHFEKTGARWATELLNSSVWKSLLSAFGQNLLFAIEFAGHRAWNDFKATAIAEWHVIESAVQGILGAMRAAVIRAVGPATWSQIALAGSQAWSIIKGIASLALGVFKLIVGVLDLIYKLTNLILSPIGGWSGVLKAALGVFNEILAVANMILGVVNAIVSATSRIHFPSMPSVPIPFGFASGSPSVPGGWSMVGEGGPELVNLPRGSSVLSTRRTAAMGGGGGVTINIFGADLSSPEQQRRVGSQIASILGSNRAGGGF